MGDIKGWISIDVIYWNTVNYSIIDTFSKKSLWSISEKNLFI